MALLRVVLAEDSYLVREGTRRVLESSGEVEVVAAVENAHDLLDAAERFAPDAVVTDIRMPPGHGTEGIVAAREIRRRHPDIGVVVLSQHADPAYVLDLFSDGTDGLAYLLKERVGDRAELLRALRETVEGRSVVDPILVEALVGRRRAEGSSPLADLTPRELEVLRLMAEGRTNAAIADELSLSESSIEKHTSVIFSKLGLSPETYLHRRVAAVVTFLRRDQIS
ncbi:MAG TPA: response regulator transcription factor [Candidatus Limnocylindria bacterium]|nr:response regulator transcription factor [Candidatus Limnocylindria bacterium]